MAGSEYWYKARAGLQGSVLLLCVWICKNQLGRRNLTEEQKSYLRGKQYEAEKMAQGGTGANQYTKEQTGQNVHLPTRRETKDGTAGRIGKQYGVNGRTGENAFIFLKKFPRQKPLEMRGY